MTFGFEGRKRPPFLLSSNTFFVQNYSQQAHASCLKGIPTRWSKAKNELSSSARGTLAPKQKKEQGVLGGNQNLVLTDPVECFYCVCVCVSLCVCICVCVSTDFLGLLVLVYVADFLGIVKSARSRVNPLANHVLSSRRHPASLASSTALLLARYYRPDTLRQVRDVLVAALGAQLLQRLVQAQQVVPVQPARPL